ncbi:hypothetical protein DSO57_1022077 [Entomophthora muscae]|uniref:Uncharacterized protein n=1 Tax=Entomophthora muscae TaxID=34485 RepID=A0ACC2TQE7_9FUNG|nr:hypothetical protein DSO57_1022077 [Entomophthora muscae]
MSSKDHNIKITHCIFDMDGLLLDTERVYSEVTSEIVGRYGKEFTWELKSKMMGRVGSEAAELLVKELQIPLTAEEYLNERNQKHIAKFPTCRPLPGVERFIKHLKKNGIPIAVGTSSHRHAYDLKVSQNQELFSLFDAIVVGDHPSIVNGKPAPDIFIEAARQIGNPDPSNCLVFEDAPVGVEAGTRAGMHVIWIPDPRLQESLSHLPNALQTLNSMEDFDPITVGLPAYSGLE